MTRDVTYMHSSIVERRERLPERRLHLGAQRGNAGGGEKPEPGDVTLWGYEGEATCHVRSLGGMLVTPVGILGVG